MGKITEANFGTGPYKQSSNEKKNAQKAMDNLSKMLQQRKKEQQDKYDNPAMKKEEVTAAVDGTIPNPIPKKYLKKASTNQPLVKEAKIDHAYEAVTKVTGCGPYDGGCVAVAHALKHKMGGHVMSLISKDGTAQHAVLHKAGKFYDFAGKKGSKESMLSKFNKDEHLTGTHREVHDVRPFDHVKDLPDAPRGEPHEIHHLSKALTHIKEEVAGFADASAPSNSNYQTELSPTKVAKSKNMKKKTVREAYVRRMVELNSICPCCNNTGMIQKFGNNRICDQCDAGEDKRVEKENEMYKQARDMIATGKTTPVAEEYPYDTDAHKPVLSEPSFHKLSWYDALDDMKKHSPGSNAYNVYKSQADHHAKKYKEITGKHITENVIHSVDDVAHILEDYKPSSKHLARTKYLVQPNLSRTLRDRLAARQAAKSKGYTPSKGTMGLAMARKAQMSKVSEANEAKKKPNYSASTPGKLLPSLSAKPMMGSSNDNRVSEAYSKSAVDKAIASSNRGNNKITGREAKMIHRLLRGRQTTSEPMMKPKQMKEEVVGDFNTWKNKLEDMHPGSWHLDKDKISPVTYAKHNDDHSFIGHFNHNTGRGRIADRKIKEETIVEGMPSGVIKHKQKLNMMEPHELHQYFKSASNGKSVEDAARRTAWRHGYGEMSPHYWNQIKDIKEEVVNELSKKTLGSYIKKAADDVSFNSFTAGNETPKKTALAYDKKAFKRQAGIGKATDKLTKEEFLADGELKKFVGSPKSGLKRKYLGAMRGRTATGQKAHAIEVDPVLKADSGLNKVVK